jgi:hypothetical protein
VNRVTTLIVLACGLLLVTRQTLALSETLHEPAIRFPAGVDAARARAVEAVLKDKHFKFVDGLVSHWEPDWATTLVYDGDTRSLDEFLRDLSRVKGMRVRVTFSRDLSKETGTGLKSGSWWVNYRATTPDTLTVRVNLAAAGIDVDKLELSLEAGDGE